MVERTVGRRGAARTAVGRGSIAMGRQSRPRRCGSFAGRMPTPRHSSRPPPALAVQFVEFAQEVCSRLEARGHWADYIDPCSGLPMVHRGTNSVYGEVAALSALLGYRTQNAGCCKVSGRAESLERGKAEDFCRMRASSLASGARRPRSNRPPPWLVCAATRCRRSSCTPSGAAASIRPACLPRRRRRWCRRQSMKRLRRWRTSCGSAVGATAKCPFRKTAMQQVISHTAQSIYLVVNHKSWEAGMFEPWLRWWRRRRMAGGGSAASMKEFSIDSNTIFDLSHRFGLCVGHRWRTGESPQLWSRLCGTWDGRALLPMPPMTLHEDALANPGMQSGTCPPLSSGPALSLLRPLSLPGYHTHCNAVPLPPAGCPPPSNPRRCRSSSAAATSWPPPRRAAARPAPLRCLCSRWCTRRCAHA